MSRDRLYALAGLVWIALVMGAYWFNTSDYYREKFSVFGAFLTR